jgi:ArsR family transcriptional regulator, arsenate/arsenite/antimonite-responsive transcriptional repressor
MSSPYIDKSKYIDIYYAMIENDRIFKALGDPARIRILEFLRAPGAGCCTFAGQICACDIERELGLSQATISHHMKLLIEAGLVSAAKRGRWMHYTLRSQSFAEAAAWLSTYAQSAAAPAPKTGRVSA